MSGKNPKEMKVPLTYCRHEMQLAGMTSFWYSGLPCFNILQKYATFASYTSSKLFIRKIVLHYGLKMSIPIMCLIQGCHLVEEVTFCVYDDMAMLL